ncbi:MAG: resolvase-like protein [Candidatus Wallbacteria bacterium]|nr:resolvase-like protein [Candidatus Wallbacteria bacterium]
MNAPIVIQHYRGCRRAKEEIENRCLPFYDPECRKLAPDGSEYELTIPYEDEADLDRQIEEMLKEIGSIAEGRYCFAESDVHAVDDPERTW